MPKLVDREQRRQEILEVTWRLMATRGADAATMREIAREAGYANGALAHYFANKDELVEAAYVHVFERTNDRIRAAVAGERGVAALRAFLVEVVPTTEVTRLEARIVLPFWNRTVTDERLARLNDAAMQRWRRDIRELLRQGREDGDVTVATADDVLADQLLALALGLQVLALLPDSPTPAATQLAMLDAALAALSPR
ncbi:transcriptional regulator, TetR family [Geodermatophilus siccatus]|uniref:Transcriptional regulator, TetR family n=1 Tax=Geodermatophilus siccatus TaxID=1137991 RepID=A0A1G9Q7U3_9ACTN|nr:TetR/AcrR family transcriptional regulator [Geodermatophilus siccatus]SDM07086.1 transcriptional regulator, TetR family [Geodermatophilus siccatus]